MPEAASLSVRVTADTSAAESTLSNFGNKLGGLANGMGNLLGGAAFLAGGAIAAGLGAGVKAAGDLEQAVAGISTVKPEIDTSAVFASLNEMQTRIPQSATSMGEALNNVFQNFEATTAQGLAAVETFSKGAIGAQTDAATFGSGIVGVLQAYGQSIEGASHVSDVFFNTIRDGAITGQQLASSLGPVSQSAKLAGVDLDTLGGLLVGVTREGGDAAQNVNNLNNFLQKVTTAEAQKAFNDLGVAVVDSKGSFRDMPDILADLKGKFGDLTEAERANALQKIFPDAQARAGAAVLLSQLDQVNASLAGNRTEVGASERAFEKMNATFNNQSKLLGQTFQSILTTVGAELLPAITPVITTFAQGLPAAFATARTAVGQFQTSLAPMVQTARDVFGTIQQVFAQNWSPSASIDPLVNSIGQVAIVARDQVLPALGALFALLQANIGTIAAVAAGFAAFAVIATIGGAIAGVATAIGTMVGVFAGAAAGLSGFSAIIAGIVVVLGGPITIAIVAVAAALGILTAAWIADWGGIQEITAAAAEVVGAALATIGEAATALWGVVGPVVTSIITEVGRFDSEMAPLAIAAWTKIVTTVGGLVTGFVAQVSADIATLTAAWTANHATIEAVTTTVWSAIVGVVTAEWTMLQGVVTAGLQLLAGDWQAAWATISAATASFLAQIEGAVSGSMAALTSLVVGAWQNIAGQLSGVWNGLIAAAGAAGAALVSAFANGIISRAQAALSAVRDLVQQARDLLPGSDAKTGPLSDLTASGKALPETLARGIVKGTPTALAAHGRMVGVLSGMPAIGAGLGSVRPGFAAMPSLAAASRGSVSGGGATVVNHYSVTVQGSIMTEQEFVDRFHNGLLVKKRTNGRLGLGDGD